MTANASLIRSFIRRSRSVVAILALSVLMMHCSDDGVSSFNLFSDADDVQLGKEVDQEIRNNPQEYPILQGRPDVKAYVKNIGDQVLNSDDVKKRGVYAYEYEIIRDDNTVNAFCTPGGYIYVYTGLLKFVDNEATLAGVMAHEIAHAEQRHATERMTKAYGVQVLLSLLLGENPSIIEQMVAEIGTGLGLLANSRSDESEADEYSFKYLQDTPYYPGAIKYFFEKIVEQQGTSGDILSDLLSTHPDPGERIADVDAMLQENNTPAPTESNLFTTRYQQFRANLP